MNALAFRICLIAHVLLVVAALGVGVLFQDLRIIEVENYAAGLFGGARLSGIWSDIYLTGLFGSLVGGTGGLLLFKGWGRLLLTSYFLVLLYPVFPVSVSSGATAHLNTLVEIVLIVILYESWFGEVSNHIASRPADRSNLR